MWRDYYDLRVHEYVEKLDMEEDDDEEEEEEVVEEAPEQSPFMIETPLIARIDMDVIKLTAQFVAANGSNFLMGLSEREAKNP